MQLFIAITAITLLTIMNVLGVKFGSLFASILTSAKFTGIFIIVIIGIFFSVNQNVNFNNTNFSENQNNLSLISAFGLALIGVTFSYGGYQHATFIAAEVKNADKIVPKAMILGIVIICLVYLTINIAYLKLLLIGEIATSSSVASDAISTVWTLGGKFISFLIILSILGTIGIYILTLQFKMKKMNIFISEEITQR